jgi:hypothetical protein
MRNRVLTCLLLAAITPLSYAKDKKKSTLPALVLNAKTVAVIINPGSETPLSGPGENVSAQSDVERALTKWGRLHVVLSPSNADLVISIRKGRSVSPTVAGGDPNRRPVIFDPAPPTLASAFKQEHRLAPVAHIRTIQHLVLVWKSAPPRIYSRSMTDAFAIRSMVHRYGAIWEKTLCAHQASMP